MEAVELFERRWAALREGHEPPPLLLVIDATPIGGRGMAARTAALVVGVVLVAIAMGVVLAGMM